MQTKFIFQNAFKTKYLSLFEVIFEVIFLNRLPQCFSIFEVNSRLNNYATIYELYTAREGHFTKV